jgi:opacity protein-like surface antigen
MRNTLVVVVLFAAFLAAPGSRAQSQAMRFELYGGYDYIRLNISTNVSGQFPSQTFNGNGGGGQFAFNVNNWLGVLGDVSGIWATSAFNGNKGGAAIPYLFGPRLNLRKGRATPFAQVLFGGVATSSGIKYYGWQNQFAMTAGGGLDVRVSEHVSLRPIQAEYFLTKIPDGLNNRQDNFRFSAGISFLFGQR